MGKAEVLLDGGIRRGTDIVKALAFGAKPSHWPACVMGISGKRTNGCISHHLPSRR